MKYLKTYESYEKPENCYWKVRTDTPYFEISLDKMGMVEDEKLDYIQMRDDNNLINQEYVYVALNYDINITGTIGSEFYYDNYSRAFDDYEYLGEIEKEITPEEIEEWHLKNDAKRYNV